MTGLFQDFRLAIRLLLSRPAFTAIAIVILALGLGANATVFGLVNAVLLRPLQVQEPQSVVRLYGVQPDGSKSARLSYPTFADLREQVRSLAGVAAISLTPVALGSDGSSEQLLAEIISGETFQILGVEATVGRLLAAEDDVPGSAPTAVISERLWRTRFESDAAALGSIVRLNGRQFTLVGVVDGSFRGTHAGAPIDLWVPILQVPEWLGSGRLQDRARASVQVLGRLQDGVDLEQAQSELQAIAVRLSEAKLEARGLGFEVVPATLLHGSIRRAASGFLGALSLLVGLVLLLACANLAALLLARALERSREIAVRLALGATRWRLLRQLFVESLLLSALGTGAGLLLSTWLVSLLAAFNPIPSVPLEFDIAVDRRVTLFTFGLGLLSAVLLGLAPALQSARRDLVPVLKGGTTLGPSRPRRLSARELLLVGQIVLSLVLLASAGLFLRSLRNATSIDPGFDTRNGLAFDVDLELSGYSEPRARRFYDNLLERISALPGVRSVALSDLAPLDPATATRAVNIEGFQPAAGLDAFKVSTNRVSPGYLGTLGIDLRVGREFGAVDTKESQPVVIVNETFASRFWPDRDPLDQTVSLPGSAAIAQVVGVARDVRYRTLGEEPTPHLYVPFSQDFSASMTVLVRTESDPQQHLSTVRAVLTELDPGVQGFFARTLVEHAAFTLLPARIGGALLGVFGLLGLVLASAGLYAAVSLSVAQRTREIGIRMALGARRVQVFRAVLGRVSVLVVSGLGIGILAALAITSLFSGFLYGVAPSDPLNYVEVSLLLAIAALAASLGPARRAIRVDPLIAIRHD